MRFLLERLRTARFWRATFKNARFSNVRRRAMIGTKMLAIFAAGANFAATCLAADLGEEFQPAPAFFLFRVNCPGDDYVAQWLPDRADRDKNYYRIATGDANLDCSIYDYDSKHDGALPRRLCQEPGGTIRGFPAFLILLGATHCK